MTRLNELTAVWRPPLQGLNTDDPVEMLPDLQSPDLVNFIHHEGYMRKVPGFAKSSTTALTIGGDTITIGRIYDFIKADGTQAYVAEGIRTGASAQRYVLKFVSGSWSATAILSGLDANAEINFATFGNYLIICNGVDNNFMSDGTAAGTFRLGISPPTNTLTAPATAGGSIPDGTYYYAYTYLNNTTGIESNPRVGALAVTYSGGPFQGTFTAPASTAAAGEGASHWKLYRTVVGGLSTGPFFFVAQGTIAASIVDNLTDTSLGAQIELDHDVAPKCQVPHVWRGRVWLTKETANPSTVYYSRVDKLGYFPQAVGDAQGARNYENVDLSDGQRMIGIGDLGNMIVFFKERSAHPYLHAGGDSFQQLSTIRTFGASNHRAILQRHGGIWTADFNGIWYFDGQVGLRVSQRIDSIFSAMSDAGKTKFHAAWYEAFKVYVLFYQRSGSTSTDAALVVDTFGVRPRADKVGLFKLEPLKCYGSGMITDSNGKPIIWIGGTAGHSYEFFKDNNNNFDGAAYTAYFKTKHFQADPHWIFRFREFIGTFRASVVTDAVINYVIDFGARAGSTSITLDVIGSSVTWTYLGSSASWTYAAVGVTWSGTTTTVTDKEAEIEGEGKAIQFSLSNNDLDADIRTSKIGMRAQRKKKAA